MLGNRDVVNFPAVFDVGYEGESATASKCNEKAMGEDPCNDPIPDRASDAASSFEAVDRRVEDRGDNVEDFQQPSQSNHIEDSYVRKQRKRQSKNNEEKQQMSDVIKEMTCQGRSLVESVKEMQEGSRLHAHALLEISKGPRSLIEKMEKNHTSRARSVNREKKQRKENEKVEDCQDSDSF